MWRGWTHWSSCRWWGAEHCFSSRCLLFLSPCRSLAIARLSADAGGVARDRSQRVIAFAGDVVLGRPTSWAPSLLICWRPWRSRAVVAVARLAVLALFLVSGVSKTDGPAAKHRAIAATNLTLGRAPALRLVAVHRRPPRRSCWCRPRRSRTLLVHDPDCCGPPFSVGRVVLQLG